MGLASDDAVDALRDAIYSELIRFMEHAIARIRKSLYIVRIAHDHQQREKIA